MGDHADEAIMAAMCDPYTDIGCDEPFQPYDHKMKAFIDRPELNNVQHLRPRAADVMEMFKNGSKRPSSDTPKGDG